MTDRSSRWLAAGGYLVMLVGPIVLLLIRRGDDLVRYHARQSLGLAATAIGVFVVWVVVGWIVSLLPYYGFLFAVLLFAVVIGILFVLAVLWIIGMVNSLGARRRTLPLIGRHIDRLFEPVTAGGKSRTQTEEREPA